MPCGESTNGIPIGAQFAGTPWTEALLCRAAHAYQSRTAWHHRRPALDAFVLEENRG